MTGNINFENYRNSWVHEKNSCGNKQQLHAEEIFTLLQKGQSVWLGPNLSIYQSKVLDAKNAPPSLFFRSSFVPFPPSRKNNVWEGHVLKTLKTHFEENETLH